MPDTLSLVDRLRIERVVWSLDQRLYDLPRTSRIAKRREVRENLQVAAAHVGVAHAIRQFGQHPTACSGVSRRRIWRRASAGLAGCGGISLYGAAVLYRLPRGGGQCVRRWHQGCGPWCDRNFHVERPGLCARRGDLHLRQRQGLLFWRRMDAVRLGVVGYRNHLRRPAVARCVALAPPPNRGHATRLRQDRI